MRVTVQANLVVGFGGLIPMESGYDSSAEKDTATVTKYNQEPSKNLKINYWWKEEIFPRLNKSPETLRNPTVDGVCDEGGLELGKDPFPLMTLSNCLKIIYSNPITYKNYLLLRYW